MRPHDRPQAHMRRADRGDRPRAAPAVAVEHRQGPEINALRVERWRMISPSAFRYAPRWEYIAPLGWPVVPEL